MTRSAVVIDLQDVAIGPGVRTVERNTDRHITKQAYAILVRVLSESLPLVVKQELDDLFDQIVAEIDERQKYLESIEHLDEPKLKAND